MPGVGVATGRGSWLAGMGAGRGTVVLLVHLAAVLAGAVGVPPSSELERAIADAFTPYFDLMDLGYSYRFYAEPPPTPVVTATIRYEDGRPEETVRLPGRGGGRDRGCGIRGNWPWPMPCMRTSRKPGGGRRMPARAGWRGPMRGTSAARGPAAGA